MAVGTKLVVGNWKMNGLREDGAALAHGLAQRAIAAGGGGMSGFMTGRSTANLLTRTTAILAVLFMVTSLSLVWFSNRGRAPQSIIEQGAPPAPAAPVAPVAPPPQTPPAEPPQPSPPLAR